MIFIFIGRVLLRIIRPRKYRRKYGRKKGRRRGFRLIR